MSDCEAYFYIAPQILIINLIRAASLVVKGIRPETLPLLSGVVAVILASLLVTAIIRKSDSEKILLFFSVYSVLFGAGVIAYILTPIFSGV